MFFESQEEPIEDTRIANTLHIFCDWESCLSPWSYTYTYKNELPNQSKYHFLIENIYIFSLILKNKYIA